MRYRRSYGTATDKQVRAHIKAHSAEGAAIFEYTDTDAYIHVTSTRPYLLVAERRYLEENRFKYDGMGTWHRERTIHPDTDNVVSCKVFDQQYTAGFFTIATLEGCLDAEDNINVDDAIKSLEDVVASFKKDIEILKNYSELSLNEV